MNMQAFLRAVRACPDDEVECGGRLVSMLTAECGICDNSLILLRADYGTIVTDFEESLKHDKCFSGAYELKDTLGADCELRYAPGTVVVRIHGKSPGCNACIHACERGVLLKKQGKDPNISLYVQPYQEKRVPNKHPLRVVAEVIEDICIYGMRKNLCFCLPTTIGWNYPGEYSRIPHYPD